MHLEQEIKIFDLTYFRLSFEAIFLLLHVMNKHLSEYRSVLHIYLKKFYERQRTLSSKIV